MFCLGSAIVSKKRNYLESQLVHSGMGWHRPHPSWDERHIHIVLQPWAHGGFEDQANAIVCSRSHGEAPSCETLANAHQGIYREIHNLNGSKLWETSTFNKKRKLH